MIARTNEEKREECCNGDATKIEIWTITFVNVEYEFLIFNLLFPLQSNAIVENFLEQNLFGAHVSERELKR